MSWRLAKSLERLRDEVDDLAPDRSTASDGTIGDQSHQTRESDHNPNDDGVVCALDLTHDPDSGADMDEIAEQVLVRRNPALKYVIWDRHIASANSEPPWSWRDYHGSNPHTVHMHVSVGVGSDGDSTGDYDNTSSWGIADASGADGSQYESWDDDADPGDRTIGMFETRPRSAGHDVKELQRILNAWYPSLTALKEDGYFGPKTKARVKYLQRRAGIQVDGVVGPQTWGALKVT